DSGRSVRLQYRPGLAGAVGFDANAAAATGRGEGGEDGGPADFPAGPLHLPGHLRRPGRPRGDPDSEELVEGLTTGRRPDLSRRRVMNRVVRAAAAAAVA